MAVARRERIAAEKAFKKLECLENKLKFFRAWDLVHKNYCTQEKSYYKNRLRDD